MPIKISFKGIGWKYNLDKLSDTYYTMDTPFPIFLDDSINIDVCPQAQKKYKKALLDNPNYTLGDMIKNYPPNPRWAKVILIIWDGRLDKETYEAFLELAEKDLIMVYRLWKELVNVTDKEREILRNKFRGKLPNIERTL